MDNNFGTLIGKDISIARKELGWWWRLDNQRVVCGFGGNYIFYRMGHNPNRIELFTDSKNIVTKVKTNLVLSVG